jgi:hypothetical protein
MRRPLLSLVVLSVHLGRFAIFHPPAAPATSALPSLLNMTSRHAREDRQIQHIHMWHMRSLRLPVPSLGFTMSFYSSQIGSVNMWSSIVALKYRLVRKQEDDSLSRNKFDSTQKLYLPCKLTWPTPDLISQHTVRRWCCHFCLASPAIQC